MDILTNVKSINFLGKFLMYNRLTAFGGGYTAAADRPNGVSYSMIVALSTTLTVAAEVAYGHVRRSALLHYVAHPLIRFRPETSFPSLWQEGSYQTKPYLLNLIPLGHQTIRIELPDGPADGTFRVRDNGQGHLARTWDHWITIEPLNANRCRYTDRVTIRAGFMTPFVWLFALGFYGWRQYRWKRLVRLNFQPILHS